MSTTPLNRPRMVSTHLRNCCIRHGCKFSEPGCVVESGERVQEMGCAWCERADRTESRPIGKLIKHPYFLDAGPEERVFLAQYNAKKFPVTTVTVDTVIRHWVRTPDMEPGAGHWDVLLIKRGNYPYKGCWALPGGFMDAGEVSLDAARREVKEEAGLDLLCLEFLVVADRAERDPRGRCVSLVYEAQATGEPFAGDDAVEAAWFRMDEALKMELAFDHSEILEIAMDGRNY